MAHQLKLVPDHFKKTKGSSSSSSSSKNKAGIKSNVTVKDDTTDDPTSSAGHDFESKLLKDFDLTCKYGPCLGMTRLERWNRAKKLGLDPPDCVYTILQRYSNDPTYSECLWKDEKGLLPQYVNESHVNLS